MQSIVAVAQPRRLYPLALPGSASQSYARSRYPVLNGGVFCTASTLRLNFLLSNFERALFPLSVATISVDESYAQSVAVISNFIAVLIQVVLLPDSISDSGCTGASVVDNDISASNSGSNK